MRVLNLDELKLVGGADNTDGWWAWFNSLSPEEQQRVRDEEAAAAANRGPNFDDGGIDWGLIGRQGDKHHPD